MDWTQVLTIIGTILPATIGCTYVFYAITEKRIDHTDKRIDHLDAALLRIDEKWDRKFIEVDEKWDKKFFEMDEKWQRLFERLLIQEKARGQ